MEFDYDILKSFLVNLVCWELHLIIAKPKRGNKIGNGTGHSIGRTNYHSNNSSE